MAMAATVKVVLGLIAFGVFWLLAVFPSVPFLPIGRTAGSLLGAMLMVVFQVLTPAQAYDAINLSILGLLFGTMVVSIYLERAEMFKYLGQMLAWKSLGPRDLLCRICLITAVASSLFTNDTCCVVLTEFVLKVARQHNLPPHPFLLALASSANIGSSATPIGNPQNLVIAIQSGISFGEFLIGILPAMIVGVVVNIIFIMCVYWKLLSSPQKDEEDPTEKVVSDEDVKSHQFSPATMAHLPDSQEGNSETETNPSNVKSHQFSPATMAHLPYSQQGNSETETNPSNVKSHQFSPATMAHLPYSQQGNSETETNPSNLDITSHPETVLRNRVTGTDNEINSSPINSVGPSKEIDIKRKGAVPSKDTSPSPEEISEPGKEDFITKCKRSLRKYCVYAITLAMLAALLAGLDLSWTAITAAIVLVVLDFKDARQCLGKVSYSLLVFFCGMFITINGFNKTGIPTALWDKLEPYAHVNSAAGTTILAVVILFLSNLASNVPTVLLLGSRVAASAAAISRAEEKKAWLILAWVSTVAGNLSLLGSAANLIVCEQARVGQFPYTLSFWRHLKFGLPSTILITAVGLTLIR